MSLTEASAELAASRDAFLAAIRGADAAQWHFRPAPDAWSLGEVAEHVTLISRDIGAMVRGPLLATPAVDDPPGEMEARIRRYLPDRTRKVAAPERYLPVGTWTTRDEVEEVYRTTREALLAWLRDTDAPLRANRLPHYRLGPLDGLEWLVFLAAHDRRHVAQIAELRAAPGYPG